ncbi:MAG: phosphopentomutase [Gemmatimonadaceae bacterium]|nr:phosphopentomutase [Gemmatimonadaceae bacterium]
MRRAALVVLDGVGIGAAHDADRYGDADSNTLGHVAEHTPDFSLPTLEALGIGSLLSLPGVDPIAGTAARCALEPASAGKDSTTGHWELCGVHLDRPFPTWPAGFPAEVVREFERLTGRRVLGNVAASGTEILERHADEHVATGAWILYTSADSVFQLAAHEDVVPLDELYAACTAARRMLVPPHDASRVIARPFRGTQGAWVRTANRRDFSIAPAGETLLDALAAAGIARIGVGKVDDLFAGRSITSTHTRSNAEGIHHIQAWMADGASGFLFANLVDFDQLYGHRNDVPGFYRALRELDAGLPDLLAFLREDDLLILTADHGNDPTTPSTDHARERVPMLMVGPRVRPVHLPVRRTFSDVGATIAEWFGLGFRGRGTSFLADVLT